MDIKRLLLALGLSFIFIITWNVFFPPPVSEEPQNPIVNAAPIQESIKSPVETRFTLGDNLQEVSNDVTRIKSSLVEMQLTNGGTSIQNLKLIETKPAKNTYKHTGGWVTHNNQNIYEKNQPVQLIEEARCNPCLLIDEELVVFQQAGEPLNLDGTHQKVTSISKNNIKKETIIYDNSYTIDHLFTGLPDKNIVLLWNKGLLPTEPLINDDVSYFSAYVQKNDTYDEEYLSSIQKETVFEFENNIGWAGLKSKYFMKAITMDMDEGSSANKVIFNAYPTIEIDGTQLISSDIRYYYAPHSFSDGTLKISSYIGPIDMKYLNTSQNKHLVQLFGFGWFFIGYLGKAIMWLLTALYTIVPNYGIVCILFAFIIRLLTGPLTKKSFLSNQKMQAIQPKLKKIQEKYKDNTGQLNQEIMSLYKNEGVNPLGGCLPILIQMPLLIALFQVFRKTIEFRGASFLPFWITDLSQPDVILQFDFLKHIWGISYFFGHGIALLPIIMGVVMFLNMKMTTSSAVNPSQASTMYIMNGFFVLLFNTFPSGLNLYYTVYNILNFFQQKKLQKTNS